MTVTASFLDAYFRDVFTVEAKSSVQSVSFDRNPGSVSLGIFHRSLRITFFV